MTHTADLEDASPPWERAVLAAIRALRFGSVEIVVHEGRVVQIETREKVRFEDADRRRPDDRGRTMNDTAGRAGSPDGRESRHRGETK